VEEWIKDVKGTSGSVNDGAPVAVAYWQMRSEWYSSSNTASVTSLEWSGCPGDAIPGNSAGICKVGEALHGTMGRCESSHACIDALALLMLGTGFA
jgi:hypothetical protein